MYKKKSNSNQNQQMIIYVNKISKKNYKKKKNIKTVFQL